MGYDYDDITQASYAKSRAIDAIQRQIAAASLTQESLDAILAAFDEEVAGRNVPPPFLNFRQEIFFTLPSVDDEAQSSFLGDVGGRVPGGADLATKRTAMLAMLEERDAAKVAGRGMF
jgi:hypothetical protein